MKKYYLFGFVLFWMILIYYFSQQTVYESIRLSRVVTMVFTNILDTFFPYFVFEVEYIHHIVRKLAHFTIYLILGVLVSYLLNIGKVKEWKIIILAVICCLLFAISDETLQLFIYGRGAQLTDVLIDIAGASLGIIIVYISRKTFNKSG
ncbi:VanZ family protein [Psychrobacillus psychrodurans]|uniref:VanZ family protein n=1 Tax=Psychrobacillus psychrodurans TaxID=126157 RepID=UPI0008F0AC55|nr:VanZ family protein [Psychrobacillus psychrodurans]MCZ8539062.1 VanZ family protein [Psychrobacillus psychrodurans]SFM27712.1 VanZ like family protein [Psychrobacillus psychrodurans]